MEKYRFITIVSIVHCLISCLAMAAITNISTDQYALLSLKAHITHDPSDLLSQNWSTTTCVCTWIGVTCGMRHHRVTSLNISYMNLVGTIPAQLGNLSFLRILAVRNNNFYGSLPDGLAQLRRLKFIDFKFNNFNTEIPSWIGSLHKLQHLLLEGNIFVGSIPQSLCNISSLQELNLSDNLLSGNIPRAIGNLTVLKKIVLHNNKLQGDFPQELRNLAELEILVLKQNALTGPIPSLIFNISSLTLLHVKNNKLTGSLPDKLYQNLPVLEGLHLSHNQFKGKIPRDLGNLTSLIDLKLGSNHLIGEIPYELGNLPNVESLGFHSNNLTGPVPATIFNISTLKFLTLYENQLSGNLPSSTDLRLTNIEQFIIWGNNFSGTFPSFLTNASRLSLLDMGGNSFSGFIPNTMGNSLRSLHYLVLSANYFTSSTPNLIFLSSFTNCKNLKHLDITENPLNGILPNSIGNLSTSLEFFLADNSNIGGPIPKEFGNLNYLVSLRLSNNELTGSIPIALGQMQKLQGLDLSSNKLKGSIPDDLCSLNRLVNLYLESNELSGAIPACLDKLSSLRSLSLGSNGLTSIIPSTLYKLKDILYVNLSANNLKGPLPLDIANLKVVISIDLSGNDLSGDIPSAIGELKDLQHLNLRDNNLHGPIPKSFGELISLEFLDLSNNNISGIIPKSLETLLYLKYLNMSFNRLQGNIPREGALANFSIESFIGNFALCGSPSLHVPPCKSSNHQKSRTVVRLLIAMPLSIGVLLVVLTFIFMLKKCQNRCRKLPNDVDNPPLLIWRRISYHEIVQATNDFSESNLLGQGSFGSVYKGRLLDGMVVAIKFFHLHLEGAVKSFDVECEVISSVRHRNLIKIIGCCSNKDFKALVLEYMPNGSLQNCLYSKNCFLNILQRLNIMIDVASALEYLHYGYLIPILHCDLKPCNVLLDENMVAHLSDFGIAKILGQKESMIQTKTLATIGYVAPEYGREGKVSRKGDVYSYGIMLMEIFTRRSPVDETFSGDMSLKQWISDSINGTVTEVVDTNLLRRGDKYFTAKEQCLSSILNVAMECTRESPKMRINIKEVLTRLLKIRVTLLENIQREGCENPSN